MKYCIQINKMFLDNWQFLPLLLRPLSCSCALVLSNDNDTMVYTVNRVPPTHAGEISWYKSKNGKSKLVSICASGNAVEFQPQNSMTCRKVASLCNAVALSRFQYFTSQPEVLIMR